MEIGLLLIAVGLLLPIVLVINFVRGLAMGDNWIPIIGWIDDAVFLVIIVLYWAFLLVSYWIGALELTV